MLDDATISSSSQLRKSNYDILSLFCWTYAAEAQIFHEKKVNTMAAQALTTCIARLSDAMVLTVPVVTYLP